MILLRHATARAAAATPEGRDRVIDLIRALGILGVVAGHFFMGMVDWSTGVPVLGNTLASERWLQAATWIFQVMPLFFIAGGVSNYFSWSSSRNKNLGFATWMWHRVERLLTPVVIYLAVMVPVGASISLFVDSAIATPLLNLTTQLLWFLGIYIIVIALTPVTARIHSRLGRWSLVPWLAVVVVVDVVRLYEILPAAVGLLNFVSVWAMTATLGLWWIQGERSLAFVMLPISVVINGLLVRFGPYPVSLVGMPNESFSNMAPPSLVMALHAISLWSFITLLKKPLGELLKKPAIWRFTVSSNLAAMTIYLWHLPALTIITVTAHALGIDRPVSVRGDGVLIPGDGFWLASPLYWISTLALVYLLVQMLWSTEHATFSLWHVSKDWRTNSTLADTISACGVVGLGISMLLISGSGLAGFPSREVEFAGLTWTPGFAIAMFALSAFVVRMALFVGNTSHSQQ